MASPTIGRIAVTGVGPVVENGERPAKSVTGEEFEVVATVFREGHDTVGAIVILTDPDRREHRVPMHRVDAGLDAWSATVSADRPGSWSYRVERWSDPYGTLHHDAVIKVYVTPSSDPGSRYATASSDGGHASSTPAWARPATSTPSSGTRTSSRPLGSRHRPTLSAYRAASTTRRRAVRCLHSPFPTPQIAGLPTAADVPRRTVAQAPAAWRRRSPGQAQSVIPGSGTTIGGTARGSRLARWAQSSEGRLSSAGAAGHDLQ
jgi:hypothetical protein